MGVLPQQLQDEIRHTFPHLRIILPAAAAVIWASKKLTGGQAEEEGETAIEETGKAVEVVFPRSRGGPKLPYKMPEHRRVILMDITLKTTVQTFWTDMLTSVSNELVTFHEKLGEKDIYLGSWREQTDGSRTRLLRFTTPLKNPLGPKQAFNSEYFTLEDISANGFIVSAHCTSEGVPFANSFVNNVLWVATEVGPQTTRVIISGECNFTGSVFGPLKGTISRESIKGMSRAYQVMHSILATKYGCIEQQQEEDNTQVQVNKTTTMPSGDIFPGGGGMITALSNSAQTNPAVLVIVLATFLLIWRMAMLNTFYLQLARQIAQHVAST